MNTMTDIDTDAPSDPREAGHRSAGVVVEGLSPAAVGQLRELVDGESRGGNRAVWFLIGFVAALAAGAIAAIGFLAVSDADDDGTVDLDVPAVEVDP